MSRFAVDALVILGLLAAACAYVTQPVLSNGGMTGRSGADPVRLETHVRALAERFSPRGDRNLRNLDAAAGYIADMLRAAGVTRLAVLHESLTKATRTVVPMRPVRSGGDHSERGGCGPPPVAAPRSGPQATRAPPQHLRAGVPRSRPRGRAACSRWRRGRPPAWRESLPGC